MGVVDKLINSLKFGDDDITDDDYADEEEDEVLIEKSKKRANQNKEDNSYEDESYSAKQSPKVSSIKQVRRTSASGMEVCVIKPTSVEEAREITETLLDNRAVVLNLEGLDVDVAQRIIDFTSGSCFAINGNLQKISNYIFIITPSIVAISGDFQEILNGSIEVPSI